MIDDINIANYADNNTPFESSDTPLNVNIVGKCGQKTF